MSPPLVTYDEIQNIRRALAPLGWAKRIVVIDSGSTDGRLEVLWRDARIETIHRPFDSFAEHRNFDLTRIRTSWILSMDADYEVSAPLIEEMRHLRPGHGQMGYRPGFVYLIYGHALSASLCPSRTILYRAQGSPRWRTRSNMPRSSSSACSVRSGFSASRPSDQVRAPSCLLTPGRPPIGRGAGLPVARARCAHFTTLAMLTRNKPAT
jgi:hypothetical protein